MTTFGYALAVGCAVPLSAVAQHADAARPDLQTKAAGPTIYPTTVQAIKGVTMDNRLVLGEKRDYVRPDGVAVARSGSGPSIVYNGAGVADTDGDGALDVACGDLCSGDAGPSAPSDRIFFGDSFAIQAVADDFEVEASALAGNENFSGFVLLTNLVSCDGRTGNEPLIVIFTLYDSVDLVADLDGTDGFDTDGDGVNDSPYQRTDADGDGLVDQFSAGVIVTVTSDGDGIIDATPGGYFTLLAEELTNADLDGDGVLDGLGSEDLGVFPSGDRDGDGRPDGTVEIFYAGSEGPDTDGDGAGDSGDIYNQFFATTNNAQTMFWGPTRNDTSGCLADLGDGTGSSEGIFWGQGANVCPPGSLYEGSDFSEGLGTVDNIWDASIEVTDFSGVVACPDPLTAAVTILGESFGDPACADSNGDGLLSPADFNAWVLAYNTQSVGVCDQNGDGLCTPQDLNAWVLNFSSAAPCP
ncbi:MAG: hypothetical protein AAFR96_05555 [Planctomycetota bacterium]